MTQKIRIPMTTIPGLIIIYPKDIVNITGRKERTARDMLSRLRKHLGKQQKDLITFEEFCTFYKLDPATIKPFLK
jgi:hypothetical protein